MADGPPFHPMRPLLLALVLLQGPAMAQPCGLWGNTPSSIGGCTVNDSMGRPAVRITEPYPGTGYRAQPVNPVNPVNPAPTYRPYGGYIGAPPSYPR
jgi:hypothetical protein